MIRILSLRLLLLLVSLTVTLAPATAQQTDPEAAAIQAQIRQELQKRGVEEAELRRRLSERGVNLDEVDTPEEALALEPIVEEIIAEIQAEQTTEPPEPPVVTTPETDTLPMPEPEPEIEEPESEIYGHQIFRNRSLNVFQATDNVRPPASYPLQPGDELAVTIFGASQADLLLTLDDDGFVRLPNGLRMPLGGVPLSRARELLTNRLANFYSFRPGQISIRVRSLRPITVNVFGEVENNGSYTFSPVNTAFNALVAAGGPTEEGTVRNIQIIDGDERRTVDVYEFLNSPRQPTDLYLSENATVYVPPARTIVEIAGGIARPFKYELREDETLAELVDFAGGLQPRAEADNIRVTRYENGSLRVRDASLERDSAFTLRNGDEVFVAFVENPIEDFVSVDGAVLLPGRYAFDATFTVDDLAKKARLRPGARQDVAFLFRKNDDGTEALQKVTLGAPAGAGELLHRGDRLTILAGSRFRNATTFTVEGAVRDTTVTLPFPDDGALLLEEALLLAGGAEPNAAPEVMIVRTPLNNQQNREYFRVDRETGGNTILQPLDRVIVYTRERFSDVQRVTISGSVRRQGDYIYDPTLSLRDLIYLAGGLSRDADPNRIDIYRLDVSDNNETRTLVQTLALDEALNSNEEDFTLSPADQVVVRSASEYEPIRRVFIRGEVRYPGPYAILSNNERLSDFIDRAGGLTEEAFPAGANLLRAADSIGYVVLDLGDVIDNPRIPSNMVLKAGDTLTVPKRQDLITIYTQGTLADRFGTDSVTVDGKIEVAFQGPRTADWYIENYAGGFDSETARRRWTTVEYANGRVRETKHFLLEESYPRVRPGAKIRVGLKPPKPELAPEERTNWGEIAQASLAGITSLVTLLVLIDRLDE